MDHNNKYYGGKPSSGDGGGGHGTRQNHPERRRRGSRRDDHLSGPCHAPQGHKRLRYDSEGHGNRDGKIERIPIVLRANHFLVNLTEIAAAELQSLGELLESNKSKEAELAELKKWLSHYGVVTEPDIDPRVDFARIREQIEREDALARSAALETESYHEPMQQAAAGQDRTSEGSTLPVVKRETADSKSGHVLNPGAPIFQPSKAEDAATAYLSTPAATTKTEEDPAKIKAEQQEDY